MNNIYMKIFLGVIVMLVLYQTIRYSQSTTFHMYNKRTTNEFKISSWSCEVDRRLIVELQEEIRSKDKLLKYREKVIGDLRAKYKKLNATVTLLQSENSEAILSETDDNQRRKRDDITQNPRPTGPASNGPTTPFPPDMDKRADKTSKPCCIALKRMTDILRTYIQRTSDLKDQVNFLENSNFTELLSKMAKMREWRQKTGNCSFASESDQIDNEKDSLFVSFDRRFVYEASPVYVDTKRRIGKNHWGIHQDVEMNKAYSLAVGQLAKARDLDAKSLLIVSGLMKVDAQSGILYVFTMTSNATNQTYMVSVQRPFGPYRIPGGINNVSPRLSGLINIIVPISGRGDRLKQFLEMIYIVCIRANINIFLTVIIYGKNGKEIKGVIRGFSKATGFQSYDILRKEENFARGRALHDGVLRWNGDNDVTMFFCDVDISFDITFLQRCSLYTEPQKSVYFPVVFSLYNPDIVAASVGKVNKINKLRANKETGVWRTLGYGMVCLSRSDYVNIGGFNLDIEGWGGEDVDLYQRFVKSSLKVIRAPDPGLFHKYHPKECDFKTLGPLRYRQCLGSKARYEASQRQLGLLLFSKETNSTPVQ